MAVLVWSVRPDLYDVTPARADAGAQPLGWPTLDELLASGDPLRSRPDLFQTEVEMAGYMFSAGSAEEAAGKVRRFLLVPNAGNWLNPPHFHTDEVVDVRMPAGRTTPLLDRQAIVVRGTLSAEPSELSGVRVVYHLLASGISAYAPGPVPSEPLPLSGKSGPVVEKR